MRVEKSEGGGVPGAEKKGKETSDHSSFFFVFSRMPREGTASFTKNDG